MLAWISDRWNARVASLVEASQRREISRLKSELEERDAELRASRLETEIERNHRIACQKEAEFLASSLEVSLRWTDKCVALFGHEVGRLSRDGT